MGDSIDRTAVDRLLSTTRAVRRRLDLDTPVPRHLLLECVALAQQAPTAVNRQAWHWLIVTDAPTRSAIGRIYRELSDRYEAVVAEEIQDRQGERVHESSRYLARVLGDVPVLVIPCLHMSAPAPMEHARAAAAYGSIFPAVWSFQLAARARGLGTVLTTLHLAREAEVAELLGVPADWRQVALIPTAYFTGETFKPAVRPPPETITSWGRWGAIRGSECYPPDPNRT
jgi:nitroreductase